MQNSSLILFSFSLSIPVTILTNGSKIGIATNALPAPAGLFGRPSLSYAGFWLKIHQY